MTRFWTIPALCAFSILGLASAPRIHAQSLAFEVASIKPSNPTPGPNDRRAFGVGGTYTANGLTLSALLSIAYGLQGYQISGGPRWMYSDRYDIVAKAEGAPNRDQFSAMLRTLLEDRFKLTTHRETKELPVYVLIIAKDGPKLKKSAEEEQYSLKGSDGKWIVSHLGMAGLAIRLSRELGQTVVDQTALPGTFDFTLEWSQDQASPAAAGGFPAAESGRPSIFTAVQEQLGLKLESRRHAVEVLIIDSADRPVEN